MFTKLLSIAALISVIGMGCSSESPMGPDESQMNAESDQSEMIDGLDPALVAAKGDGGHDDKNDEVTFTVTIENVSNGMTLMLSNGETAPAPISPGVWAITALFNPLFEVGRYDQGLGLEAQAEDGNPTILAGNIEGMRGVKSSGVFTTPVGGSGPAPAFPGDMFQFTVTAHRGERLTFSSMFGQSNDLFYSTGAVGVPLFKWNGQPVEGDVTRYFYLWDAGTEVNQEPGLGGDQAPRQSGPNMGESEHKRIRRVHDGYSYPRTNKVIKVTITPMSSVS